MVAFALLVGYASPGEKLKSFKSPDGRLAAVVIPVSKQRGFEENESRISIQTNGASNFLSMTSPLTTVSMGTASTWRNGHRTQSSSFAR